MTNMAAMIHEKGAPDVFRWEEWPVGEPGPGELRIRHGAVGVNYVDTHRAVEGVRTTGFAVLPPTE